MDKKSPKIVGIGGQVLNEEESADNTGSGYVSMPIIAGLPGGVFVNLDAISFAEPSDRGEGIVVHFQGGKSKRMTESGQALAMVMLLSDMTMVRPDPNAAARFVAPAESEGE